MTERLKPTGSFTIIRGGKVVSEGTHPDLEITVCDEASDRSSRPDVIPRQCHLRTDLRMSVKLSTAKRLYKQSGSNPY